MSRSTYEATVRPSWCDAASSAAFTSALTRTENALSRAISGTLWVQLGVDRTHLGVHIAPMSTPSQPITDKFKLYIITNAVNGKRYVGLTTQSLKKRWNNHLAAIKNPTCSLHMAILKYGRINFSIEHIACARSFDDLAELEKIMITQENTFFMDRHGYNMTTGGDGTSGRIFRHSAETIARISNTHSGKVLTAEHKARIGMSHKGKPACTKAIMALKAALTGVPKTSEHKAKLSAAKRGILWGDDRRLAAKGIPWTNARRMAQQKRISAKSSNVAPIHEGLS